MKKLFVVCVGISLLSGCANLKKRSAEVSEIRCYAGEKEPYFTWTGDPKTYKIRRGMFHLYTAKRPKRLLGTLIGNCVARNFWKQDLEAIRAEQLKAKEEELAKQEKK